VIAATPWRGIRDFGRLTIRISALFIALAGLHRVVQVRLGEALHYHGLLDESHWLFRSLRWSGAAGTDWVVWSRLYLNQSEGVMSGWFAVPLENRFYTSQAGFGTWLLTAPFAPVSDVDVSLRLMYTMLAIASLFGLELVRRSISNLLGCAASIGWIIAFFMPWGFTMWSSAYWNLPSRLLPCLALLLFRNRFPNRRLLESVVVGSAFAATALSNYELITLTVFFTLALSIAIDLLEDQPISIVWHGITKLTLGLIVAGVVAVSVHFVQLRMIAGSFAEALHDFGFNFTKRSTPLRPETFEFAPERSVSSFYVLRRVFSTPVVDPLRLPVVGGIPFWTLLVLNVVLFALIRSGWRRDTDLIALQIATILSACSVAGVATWTAYFAPHINDHMPFGRGALFFSAVPSSVALTLVQLRCVSAQRALAATRLRVAEGTVFLCGLSVLAAAGLRVIVEMLQRS